MCVYVCIYTHTYMYHTHDNHHDQLTRQTSSFEGRIQLPLVTDMNIEFIINYIDTTIH